MRLTARRSPDAVCRPAERDEYVTDGRRLYRVIAPADPTLGTRDAVLEDCATLTWRTYTVAELFWTQWEPVRRDGATEPVWRDPDPLHGDLRMADRRRGGTLAP